MKEDSLMIRHYGDRSVKYSLNDDSEFMKTNENVLSLQLIKLFAKQSCNFGFVSYLFFADLQDCVANDSPGRVMRSTGNVIRSAHSIISHRRFQ